MAYSIKQLRDSNGKLKKGWFVDGIPGRKMPHNERWKAERYMNRVIEMESQDGFKR